MLGYIPFVLPSCRHFVPKDRTQLWASCWFSNEEERSGKQKEGCSISLSSGCCILGSDTTAQGMRPLLLPFLTLLAACLSLFTSSVPGETVPHVNSPGGCWVSWIPPHLALTSILNSLHRVHYEHATGFQCPGADRLLWMCGPSLRNVWISVHQLRWGCVCYPTNARTDTPGLPLRSAAFRLHFIFPWLTVHHEAIQERN